MAQGEAGPYRCGSRWQDDEAAPTGRDNGIDVFPRCGSNMERTIPGRRIPAQGGLSEIEEFTPERLTAFAAMFVTAVVFAMA